MRIDHVQVAIPAGGEQAATAFYAGLLGMESLRKPSTLEGRGGCWFRAEDAEIHCGVDDDFRPARKAHPGIEVEDFDGLVRRLEDEGLDVRHDDLLPGRRRCYVDDPFGNRIELLERLEQRDDEPEHPFVFGACYRVKRDFGITAPDAAFEKGQVVRFEGYSGYSRWDDAHVYGFRDTGSGARLDLWWFADDQLEDIVKRLEPTWCE